MKIELVPKYQVNETYGTDDRDLDLADVSHRLNEIKAIVGKRGYIAYHVDQALKTTALLIERQKLSDH